MTKFINFLIKTKAITTNELIIDIIKKIGCVIGLFCLFVIVCNFINIYIYYFYLNYIVDTIFIICFIYCIIAPFYFYYDFKTKHPKINSNNYSFKRNLALRLVVRYVMHLLMVSLSLFLLFILCIIVFATFDLRQYTLIYSLGLTILEFIMSFFPLIFLIIFLIITYYDFLKPLNYLDNILIAVSQINQNIDSPIQLPEEIAALQNPLNEIRLTALNNQKQAKESNRRKDELVTYLAHDLKTPLTSVIGYLTLLDQEEKISKKMRDHYIDIALDKAYRVEDLINELFEVTHFNLTQMEIAQSKVDIILLIEQTLYEFNPLLNKRHLIFEFNHPMDSLELLIDADKMQRVFENLIKNAINYAYENSTITLDTTLNENTVIFKLSNQGNTIHPDKLKRIFDPFYRGDNARNSSTGGSGLGLAIVKEIIDMHQGSINVKSQNETITFTLILPLS